MRDEVLMSPVGRAMNDAEFRQTAGSDPGGTLAEYGYDLSPEGLAAVTEFQAQTAGMSEDELHRHLASNAGQHRMLDA